MPWLEASSMEQRDRFITAWPAGDYSRTELCARYGVSRKTGYKWVKRFVTGGRAALQNRSHVPHHCPHRIADAIAAMLCATREAHPSWGPVKVVAWLAPRHPDVRWPAASTVGDLFARRGLVPERRRRRVPMHRGAPPVNTTGPNDVWAIDFKGQFRTRDRRYCYPLTVTDQHTRFLLVCQGLRSVESPAT